MAALLEAKNVTKIYAKSQHPSLNKVSFSVTDGEFIAIIFLILKKKEPKVVLATVYNNLNMLCDKELIRKISLEGSPDRYDRKRRHDHLVYYNCKSFSVKWQVILSSVTACFTPLNDAAHDIKTAV